MLSFLLVLHADSAQLRPRSPAGDRIARGPQAENANA